MRNEEQEAVRAYVDYFQAFQELKPDAVVSRLNVPCIFLSPQGAIAMSSAEAIDALMRQLMQGLKQQGFGRSEISDLRAQQVSDSVVFVDIRGIRYHTDGSILERFATTNTLRKTDAGWKIVQIAMHDVDVVLELKPVELSNGQPAIQPQP